MIYPQNRETQIKKYWNENDTDEMRQQVNVY